MVRLLFLLSMVGLSQAHVCSIDEECDPPQVCTAPPLKWGSCVDPSRKLLLSDPDRINCLDGSACPADQKCFRVMGSPIGVCVPKESPPDSEPARNCVQSSQCKSSERCYRPAGTPIGVCVPAESRKLFLPSKPCQFDGDCEKDEYCGKPYPAITGKCFKKSRRFAGDECYFHDSCLDGQFCDNGKCYDEITGQPVKRRLTAGQGCRNDFQCSSGEFCKGAVWGRSGQCTVLAHRMLFELPGTCKGNGPRDGCPYDMKCEDGECVPDFFG